MEDNTKLTDENVVYIYNELDKMDTNSKKEILEEVQKDTTEGSLETLAISENMLGGIYETNDDITEEQMRAMGLDEDVIEDLKDVKPAEVKKTQITADDIKNTLGYYNMDDTDAVQLYMLAKEYMDYINNGKGNDKYYDRLPSEVKALADGIRLNTDSNPALKMSKEQSARFVLDNIIKDSEFGRMVDDFNTEITTVYSDAFNNFQNIIAESFDEMRNRAELLKEQYPDKAEAIQKLYDSFKNASTFDIQLKYVRKIGPKRLKKLLNRYDRECDYFNTKVNTQENKDRGILFPDISLIGDTIYKARSGFTRDQIKMFIIVYIESLAKWDFRDINNLFYIYGGISAIDSFRYNSKFDTDFGKELFDNVSKVIQEIIDMCR